MKALLRRDDSSWEAVERLIREEKLVELDYLDNKFYMRRISSRSK